MVSDSVVVAADHAAFGLTPLRKSIFFLRFSLASTCIIFFDIAENLWARTSTRRPNIVFAMASSAKAAHCGSVCADDVVRSTIKKGLSFARS